ncbi:MAG: MBL fold metallo-hydrolase [Rugosibacter sp.]|nr:MBL fold metallo-hydrolase [Rugosibacter sp.]
MKPAIQPFFDIVTGTITYIVFDVPGGHAAIIDPVLDYDPKSGRTHTALADQIISFITQQKLAVDWILETHAHADHLSAAHYLKSKLGGRIAIGEHIKVVQNVFKGMFNLAADFAVDGSQFDHLFADNEEFNVGQLTARALFVPGHTPADIAYQFDDAIFVGDTLFMPDVGSARCDFPGGNAEMLYQSVQRLFAFPDNTCLFMCHDYPPADRAPAWQTTVGSQRKNNIHLHNGVNQENFVQIRQARDATLDMPVLILPSVQVNIRAGEMPAAESNGVSYLKIPLNLL